MTLGIKGLGGSFIVGILVGLVVYKLFFVPTFTDKTNTSTKVDTTYTPTTVTLPFKEFVVVKIPSVPVYHSDTVINELTYPVNNYTGSERTLYGNVTYDITTAGYLTAFKFKPDFATTVLVPTTTVTTNKETLRVIHPKGLYLTGTLATNYGVGATYLNNKFLIGYQYQPQTLSHSVSVGYKLF